MALKVGHYMGELGEAQSNALGGQLTLLMRNTEVLLVPVDPGTHPPGLEGVFASALEVALLNSEIDMVVAGLHEIVLEPPEGVKLAAVTQRVDARDAFVSSSSMPLRTLPEDTEVYVDGPRRARQLMRIRSDLEPLVAGMRTEEMLAAVDSEEDKAAIVCLADLRWTQKESMASDILATDEMLPAPGQGALGLLVREGDAASERAALIAHHKETSACVGAERECLRRLGCSIYSPVGALAHVDGGGALVLQAAAFGPGGGMAVRATGTSSVSKAAQLGGVVADELLRKGGGEIIREAHETE
jgi:hydroxymethylbilane synthase